MTRKQEYAQRLVAFERAADLQSMGRWGQRLAQQRAILREAAERAMRTIKIEGNRTSVMSCGSMCEDASARVAQSVEAAKGTCSVVMGRVRGAECERRVVSVGLAVAWLVSGAWEAAAYPHRDRSRSVADAPWLPGGLGNL